MNTIRQMDKYRLLIPAFLLSAIYVVAGLIPIDSLWGFNHLKYFPGYVSIIYALIALLIITPFIGNRLFSLISKFAAYFQRLNKPLRIIIISVIAGVLFHFLRVHVHSIGDGYQRIYEIKKGLLYYYTEPLDFFLHAVLYRVLLFFGINSAELSYQIISILTGVIFINTIYLFKFPEQIKSSVVVLAKILILASAGLQMYFGYVESYSLYYLFGIFFLLWSLKFLMTGGGLIAASITLSLAIAAHLTALFLLPAYIYLIHYKIKNIRPRGFVGKYLPIVIVGLVLGGLSYFEIRIKFIEDTLNAPYTSVILPIFSSAEYSILSAQHLYDILNEILLSCPYCFLLGALIFPLKKQETGNKQLRFFTLLLILSALLTMFTIDPLLGYARDWDLFSTPAVIFGFSFTLLVLFGRDNKIISKYNTFVIGSLSILFLSGWILMNSSAKKQLDRANDLLELSNKGYQYCAELLAYYYRHEKGDNLKAIELYKSINNYKDNARLNKKLGDAQKDLGRYYEAKKSYDRALIMEPMNPILLNKIGQVLLKQSKFDSAVVILKKAHRLARDSTSITEALALAHIYKDEYEKALSWADSLASKDAHSPGASLIRLTIAARQGDWASARNYYLEFLQYGRGRSDYENMRDYYKSLK